MLAWEPSPIRWVRDEEELEMARIPLSLPLEGEATESGLQNPLPGPAIASQEASGKTQDYTYNGG